MPALTHEERQLLDPDGSFLRRLAEDITLDDAFVAGTPVSVAAHIQPLVAAIASAIRVGRKSG